jgi:hypothetical protein
MFYDIKRYLCKVTVNINTNAVYLSNIFRIYDFVQLAKKDFDLNGI